MWFGVPLPGFPNMKQVPIMDPYHTVILLCSSLNLEIIIMRVNPSLHLHINNTETILVSFREPYSMHNNAQTDDILICYLETQAKYSHSLNRTFSLMQAKMPTMPAPFISHKPMLT